MRKNLFLVLVTVGIGVSVGYRVVHRMRLRQWADEYDLARAQTMFAELGSGFPATIQ